MNEFMTIPGTTYIVTPDLKIINSKTNKENRCTNISVLMDDGLRHGFRRERLIYAAKNNINPLHIPKYIIVVASSSKYGDYMEGGKGSTMWLDDLELVYPKSMEEVRK